MKLNTKRQRERGRGRIGGGGKGEEDVAETRVVFYMGRKV
jgi:hypothetical protein